MAFMMLAFGHLFVLPEVVTEQSPWLTSFLLPSIFALDEIPEPCDTWLLFPFIFNTFFICSIFNTQIMTYPMYRHFCNCLYIEMLILSLVYNLLVYRQSYFIWSEAEKRFSHLKSPVGFHPREEKIF